MAACTNPGFIIGNEQIQLAKAQDYDLKHHPSRSVGGLGTELGQGGSHGGGGDALPLDGGAPGGGGAHGHAHSRQKSVLHKDFHMVSRHDRNTSTNMYHGRQVTTNPNLATIEGGATQQYELANMESQPSEAYKSGLNNPMERTLIKHLTAAAAPGQFDAQMSMQLYGQHPAAMNQQQVMTTQASTVPTQSQVPGKGKKPYMKGKAGGAGKRIPAYVKGIPTNQIQLQAKKGHKSQTADAQTVETENSGTQEEGSNKAFDMIQKRIKEA